MSLFISEYYLKTATTISQNVDVKDIVPNIQPAQEMFVREILTEDFYDYLLSAYTAQSLTSDEESLVLKIKPAVAWRAAEMTLPFLNTQVKNKGLQSQFTEYSQPVTREDMSYLRNELANRAEFYEQKLVDYLIAHKSLYPTFPGFSGNNLDNRYDSGVAPYNDFPDASAYNLYRRIYFTR